MFSSKNTQSIFITNNGLKIQIFRCFSDFSRIPQQANKNKFLGQIKNNKVYKNKTEKNSLIDLTLKIGMKD